VPKVLVVDVGGTNVKVIATGEAERRRRPSGAVNDAAIQALGSYEGGKMLFIGLGTGLGSAFAINGLVAPMELGHLP
jgi:hypothetical protein